VLPAQAGEAGETAVGAVEGGTVLYGEGGEVGVREEVSASPGLEAQALEDVPVAGPFLEGAETGALRMSWRNANAVSGSLGG